jgi:myo-inositol-1(or 4)-monophosphatase
MSPMMAGLVDTVKQVARIEIMPRYLKVAHERKSDGSLFTQADIAAQDYLTRELKRIADCPVLGEEMSEAAQHALWDSAGQGALSAPGASTDKTIWCVDPIDGTSNFVNGIPYFGVSVALMRQGRPLLGVVFDPVADEAFYAEAGQGAYLNGEALPIKQTVPDNLRRAVAEVDLKRLTPALGEALGRKPPYMSQRNFGASTLDWCYVAAGRFDLYLHGGQKLWDYAAGSLILAEAGGHMCTLDGDDFWAADLWHRSAIAALDGALFQEWVRWIREHR